MLGAEFLGGIGFTMSLFIAGLALDENIVAAGKIGTLIGSALSAVVGLGWPTDGTELETTTRMAFWLSPRAKSRLVGWRSTTE